jgi:hypothetical protein
LSVFYSPDLALVDAVSLSDADDVRRLLGDGADPDARDERRRPALMIATAEGDVASARLLLEAGADPNLRDADDWTALDVAAYRQQRHLFRLLVEFGAEPTRRADTGSRVLLRALRAGDHGTDLAATTVALARCCGLDGPPAHGRAAN